MSMDAGTDALAHAEALGRVNALTARVHELEGICGYQLEHLGNLAMKVNDQADTIHELRRERDHARSIAVRLEQEIAELTDASTALVRDMQGLDAASALNLDMWPAARRFVEHAGRPVA